MVRCLFLFLVFCLTVISVDAQEPPEWPPDVEGWFTDEVEIALLEGNNNQPIVELDMINREVIVYDWKIGEWSGYPYPPEVNKFQQIYPDGNGRFILTTNNLFYPMQHMSNPEGYWIFDPTILGQGAFSKQEAVTRPELICGELKANAGDGRWVAIQEGALSYLCFTENGEKKGPLPPSPIPYQSLSTSPDGEFVILAAGTIYSYELSIDKLEPLGSADTQGVIHFDWITARKFVFIVSPPDEWTFRTLYSGEIGIAESIQSRISSYHAVPEYSDNPPRYYYVSSQYEIPEMYACTMNIFYPDTWETVSIILGDQCETNDNPMFPDDDSKALMIRIIFKDRPGFAQLATFDPVNREKVVLYEGEIEWFHNPSPDSRFIPLLLDSNGRIDIHTNFEWSQFGGVSDGYNPQLVFWDQETGEFASMFTDAQCPLRDEIDISNGGTIKWLNERIVVVYVALPEGLKSCIVDLVTGQHTVIDGAVSENLDSGQYVTVFDQGNRYIFDIYTWEIIHVMRPIPEGYRAVLNIEDDRFTVLIRSEGVQRPDPPYLIYEITNSK